MMVSCMPERLHSVRHRSSPLDHLSYSICVGKQTQHILQGFPETAAQVNPTTQNTAEIAPRFFRFLILSLSPAMSFPIAWHEWLVKSVCSALPQSLSRAWTVH